MHSWLDKAHVKANAINETKSIYSWLWLVEQTRDFDKEVVLLKNTAAGVCASLIHSSGKGYFFSIESKSKSEKKKYCISIKKLNLRVRMKEIWKGQREKDERSPTHYKYQQKS